jgi:hypothetical protein
MTTHVGDAFEARTNLPGWWETSAPALALSLYKESEHNFLPPFAFESSVPAKQQ